MALFRALLIILSMAFLASAGWTAGRAANPPSNPSARKSGAPDLSNGREALRLLEHSKFPLKEGKEDCGDISKTFHTQSLGALAKELRRIANDGREVKCKAIPGDIARWACTAHFMSKTKDPETGYDDESAWTLRYEIQEGQIQSLVCFLAG
jgi:hypothetical protein